MNKNNSAILQENIEIHRETLRMMSGMAQELKGISEGHDRDLKVLVDGMNSLGRQTEGMGHRGIRFDPWTRQGRQQMRTQIGKFPMRISALERRLTELRNRLHATSSGDSSSYSSDD